MLAISGSTFFVSILKSSPSSIKYPISKRNFLYSKKFISFPLFILYQSFNSNCKSDLFFNRFLFKGSNSSIIFEKSLQNLSILKSV